MAQFVTEQSWLRAAFPPVSSFSPASSSVTSPSLASPSLAWALRSRAVAAAALLAFSVLTAQAQAPAALPGQAPSQTTSETPGQLSDQPAAAASGSDDAWLAKTGKLYYSSAKAGLSGFDCAVHPDWRVLFRTASPGTAISDDDAHLALLNSVRINLHAHMQGGSTMDWSAAADPAKPLDDASTQMLTRMRDATEQTLEGFLQFWTPFIDGSVVPDSAAGLTITHSATLHTIHAEQSGVALTEIFSSDLLLEHFDVDMKNVSIKFQPAYAPTDQGLLVKSFQAHVQPAGAAPDQAQDMHVDIAYQTLDGFPIPAHLNMQVANSGTFSFVFDGCTVNRLQQPDPPAAVKPALP